MEDGRLGVGEDVVDRLAMTVGDDSFGVLVGERQAVDTLLLGLKVRSKPATGALFPGTLSRPPSGSPDTGSQSATSMLKRCSSLTCEPFSIPFPPSRSLSPAPGRPPAGCCGGVVVGETLGRLRVPVTGRDRVDEVAVATAKTHPPDEITRPSSFTEAFATRRLLKRHWRIQAIDASCAALLQPGLMPRRTAPVSTLC